MTSHLKKQLQTSVNKMRRSLVREDIGELGPRCVRLVRVKETIERRGIRKK